MKLAVNRPGDSYEQEADRTSELVMQKQQPHAPCHCGGRCSKCRAANADHGPERLQLKRVQASTAGAITAPPVVDEALRSPGQPLDAATRSFMEQRFGHDFSGVRVHSGATAERSAQEVNALAYTVGEEIVFGTGRFAPGTHEGRRLIAHELTHVVQQSGAERSSEDHGNSLHGHAPDISSVGAGTGIVQRAPADEKQADYEKLVAEGKWCRDSEKSGELHPGLQCYREIPSRKGYPAGNQTCFNKDTGAFAEESPDFISAVSGQNKDGTCDIPLGITDPPQPFTQRGRRALGHLIADIGTEDPDLIGKHFGRISGVAMGIALPKNGLDRGLADVIIPALLGYVGGELASGGLPLLNRMAQKHGFLPTISLGASGNAELGVGIGLEKRDRPLPLVPINTYLSLGVDTSLDVAGQSSGTSTHLAKIGIRIDPGKQGGFFATGAVGAGLRVGDDISGVTSTELGVGFRATDFLDIKVVNESVSGDSTYWVTINLTAPQSVLKGHPKHK